MKYCPYCGASVLDDAVSFCSECGKSLNASIPQREKDNPKPIKTKTVKRSTLMKKKPELTKQPFKAPISEQSNATKAYDGYYEDIVPTDNGRLNEGLDRILIKKIAYVIVGVLIVIGLSIAVMYIF